MERKCTQINEKLHDEVMKHCNSGKYRIVMQEFVENALREKLEKEGK